MLNLDDIDTEIEFLQSVIHDATQALFALKIMRELERRRVARESDKSAQDVVLAQFDKLGIKLPLDQINFVGY